MGYSISKVAMKFGFSSTTISRVYREYRESGKTSILQHRCGRKKIMQEWDQGQLTRSLSVTDVQPFRKLQQILMLVQQQVTPCETFNETSSIWVFWSRRPTRVPLLTARYKALRLVWARQDRH
ncbi:uncharacterized protein TNCV_364041 [Trichonephila clavipes]|uniref:Uncharacterized protein n=1 Tax=Trichonephila clavipes TaxID=2585209 RepID=A0A8X6SG03_TRICX|nr:uncharacterized protein TNCV_364041 [Trichonephila clavipes]